MTTPESLPPLLPCPFCGRAQKLMERPDNAAETAFIAAVVCYCGGYASCAHKMVTSNTQAEATRAVTAEWNQRAALSSRQVQPEHPMACWSVDVHDDDDGRTWINIRNPDDDVACLSAKTMIRRGQRSIAASVLYEFHAAWTAMHEQPAQAEACCPVGQICSRCAAGISSLMDGRSAQAEAVEPVADYGGTDFGWTYAIGRALEPQEERLMAMLVKAFGSHHPAIDDMANLIMTRQPAPTAVPEDVRRDAERLDALSRPGWELSENSDPECMPHEQWQVHRVSGGRNDREWTLIGQGESPRAAIDAAMSAEKGGV